MDEIFERILVYAERYALGRRTYAVSDVCDYVKPLIPQLSKKCLTNLNDDFQSMSDQVACTGIEGLWGMDCDKRDWLQLWFAVKHELRNREETGDG